MIARVTAETLGLKALGFLAAAPEHFQRFLRVSGLDTRMVRTHAAEPEFLTGVLDFMLAQEPLLTAFCTDESIEPRLVHLARRELAGPSEE